MADFDPDIFIGNKPASTTFDPDAFLNQDSQRAAPKSAKKGIPQDTLGGRAKPAPQEKDAPREVGGLLADIALEGGGATAGQALGALAAPYTFGASIPLGGAIGGVAGNLASQKRRILAGEQRGYRAGEALSSALTGAIPGAALEASGVRAIAREGLKQAAGGVTGKALETLVDEGRLPSAAETAITTILPAVAGVTAQRMQATNPSIVAAVADAGRENATRRATLAAGREVGYVLPPSTVNPGLVTNTLESIGGKAATGQAAALRNQQVTNRLAKEALGLPENVDITEAVLRDIRTDAARPYAEIEAMATRAQTDLDNIVAQAQAQGGTQHGTAAILAQPAVAQRVNSLAVQAGADVRELRKARNTANGKFRQFERSADPDHLDQARAAAETAEQLEDRIERAVTEFGTPELLTQLRAARTRIAQTYDVERALNLADANVSAPIIGRALDKGKPLTGELATIGRFAEAFPSSVREGSKVPTPGVSALLPIGSALGSIGGAAAFGPVGALMGLTPYARGPVRSLLLSEPYQNFATRIPLSVDAFPPAGAVATRAMTQEAAQEIAEEAKPKKDEKPAETPKPEPPPKKSAMIETSADEDADLPTLTTKQAKKAPIGTKFLGTNGLAYEKLANGKIEQLS